MRWAATVVALLGAAACVNTTQGRPYACAPDGGAEQCSGGFICALEGFCRDPNQPGAHRCERDSGFGCAPGWLCQLNGTCRDADAGGPFLCERSSDDAGDDCGNSGWRCGKGAPPTCQPRGVAAAYPCGDDFDCEGGWRCGLGGFCADPSQDDLLPHGDGGVRVELVSPRFGNPSLVSVNPSTSTLDDPPLVIVQGTQLISTTASGKDVRSFTLPSLPLDVATSSVGTAYIDANDKLYRIGPDGGAIDMPIGKFKPVGLFPLATFSGGMLVIGEDGGMLLDNDGLGNPGFYTPAYSLADGGDRSELAGATYAAAATIYDQSTHTCLFVMHSRGIAAGPQSEFATGDFVELPLCVLPGCNGMATNSKHADLRLSGGNLLAVRFVPADNIFVAVNPSIAVIELVYGKTTAGNECAVEGGNVAMAACEYSCPTGELVDYRPASRNGFVGVEVVCRESTPGQLTSTRFISRPTGPKCETVDVPEPEASTFASKKTVSAPHSPTLATYFSPEGHIWLGQSASQRVSLVMDSQLQARLELAAEQGGAEFFFTVDDQVGRRGGLGLAPFAAEGALGVALVKNAPGWFVAQDRNVNEVRSDGGTLTAVGRGRIGVSSTSFEEPVFAAVHQAADGKRFFSATVFDAFVSAPVPEDGGTFNAPVRVVPSARSPISSYVIADGAFDGGYARGWAVTGAGVFELRGETATRWKALPVALPEIDPVEVWADGARGRVGMRDGRIFALASRTQVAPPVTAELTPVLDYATQCGDVFALTENDLWRLQPGRPEGRWERVMNTVLPTSESFIDARFVESDDALFLALESGRTFQLESAACTP